MDYGYFIAVTSAVIIVKMLHAPLAQIDIKGSVIIWLVAISNEVSRVTQSKQNWKTILTL